MRLFNVVKLDIVMKKKVISLLVVLAISCGLIYAQTVLLDFDEVNYDNWDGWNAVMTTVDNPVSDGVNSSAKVGYYFSDTFIDEYGIWGLAWFDLPPGENITFGSTRTLSLKVLATAEGGAMIVKLEDKEGETEAVNIEISASAYEPGGWEILTYDFSSASDGVYDRVAFYSSNYDTWYIDDLIIDNEAVDPEIIISDDGEIQEGLEDGEIVFVELKNDEFVTTLDPSNWLMNNLPAGVSRGTVTRIDSTHAEITLSGNATESYNGTNITDVAVAVKAGDLLISAVGLTAMTGVSFIAIPTGVDFSQRDEIRIYPNPVSNIVTVQSTGCLYLEIYDILGGLVQSQEIASEFQSIDFSKHPIGMYLVKLKQNDGKYVVQILIKK